MSRTVVVAQARMSSTRLPGKVLMDLAGRPVIDHVVDRCRRAELADEVWVATTTDPSDDVLAEHLRELDVPFVRGSLDDVLSRYVLASERAEAHTVVRVTCDCPLIDPEVIDRVIEAFNEVPEVDYCSNVLVRTYPIGMDTEVFSRAALERAAVAAVAAHEREHVTPYIYQHPDGFRLRNVEAPPWANRPELRLTVDEMADLEMMRALVGCARRTSSLQDVMGVLDANPAIALMNATVDHRHVERPASW